MSAALVLARLIGRAGPAQMRRLLAACAKAQRAEARGGRWLR